MKPTCYRYIEGARGGDCGEAEWALGGDIDDIGRILFPAFAQRAFAGESESQAIVTGEGQASHDAVATGVVFKRFRALARAHDGDGVSACPQSFRQSRECHRNSIDFRWVGLGYNADFHYACSSIAMME